MPRLSVLAALVIAVALVGFTTHDADAGPRRSAWNVRMKAADADASGVGRLRFRTRRGTTFMSASFARLAPNAIHTVHWDAVDQDGPQFVTNHWGRAKLRRMSVPAEVAASAPQVSIEDGTGEPVLTCDPDSMPGMHGATGDHASHHDADGTHDMTGMMGDHAGMCSQECMDHCANGGTCDEQCHQDHGCTDSCCCSGAMDGSSAAQHCASGMQSGTTSGGMMHR